MCSSDLLIANAYQGDTELLDKYYNLNRFNLGVKVDFPTAVLDTLDIIDEVSKVYKLSYYKVIYQKGNLILPVFSFGIGRL